MADTKTAEFLQSGAPLGGMEGTGAEQFNDGVYRIYFEKSAVGLAVTSPDKRWLLVNPALCGLLGRSFEELQEMTWADLTHPEDLEADNTRFEELVSGVCDSYQLEKRFVRKDGGYLPTLISVSCVRNPSGEVAYFLAQVQDISALKHAQQERDRSVRALTERVKELSCLHEVGKLIETVGTSLETVVQGTAELLSRSMQYVDDTVVRIKYAGNWYTAGGEWGKPADALQAEIASGGKSYGIIEVGYRHPQKAEQFGPFLKEEKDLLESVASRLFHLKEKTVAEEAFRQIAEVSPDMFYMMSLPEGVYQYVNPASTKLFGYRPEEFGNNPKLIQQIIHPEWHEYFAREWQRLLSGEVPPTYEYKIVHKNGEERWMNQRNVLLFEGGRPAAIWGIVTDVTENKKILRRLESINRELEVRTGIAETFLNKDGDDLFAEILDLLLDLTDSRHGVFGYINEKGDLVVPTMTRHIWEECAVPEKDIVFPCGSWGDSIWPRALRTKQLLYSNERSERTPEGHIPVERNMAAPIIFKGEVVGLLQVGNKETDYDEDDLTMIQLLADTIAPILQTRLIQLREKARREAAEQAVLKEREQLLAVLDGIEDVIYVADPESYELLHVNQTAIDTWGKDLIGQKCYRVLQDRDEPCPFCTNDRIFGEYLHESYVWEFQNEVNGRWYRCADKAIQWINGRLVRFELASDITPLKDAEERLEQAVIDFERSNKELEQFAYVASHDLQEPLRMVASYTELLKERYEGQLDEKADKYIGYAVDGAKRMQRLISDLLVLSRVNTRGKELVPVDCRDLCQKVVHGMQHQISESGAEIVAAELPVVNGDDVQLFQLFQNMLSNALKFRGAGHPVVELSAVKRDKFWEFSCRDNGIGIEPQFADRIFVIFQRLNERDLYPGTGIGLAVAKKIVERHGGSIWLDTDYQAGSLFKFTLPDVCKPTTEVI